MLQHSVKKHGMALIESCLIGCFKKKATQSEHFTIEDNIKREKLVDLLAQALNHYSVGYPDENSKFMACQCISDLESTIPGIAGTITVDSVHPAWGGKFGLTRFGTKQVGFKKQLRKLFETTQEERKQLAEDSPIELALQGHAALFSADGFKESLKVVKFRTGEECSPKDTEHEGCKAGTGAAQAHTTRTVSKQRVQTKLCSHPVPGTDEQRAFLRHDLKFFRIISAALAALPAEKVIGDYAKAMHYFKPSWHGDNPPPFEEFWYTWGGENVLAVDGDEDMLEHQHEPTADSPRVAALPAAAAAEDATHSTRKRAATSTSKRGRRKAKKTKNK